MPCALKFVKMHRHCIYKQSSFHVNSSLSLTGQSFRPASTCHLAIKVGRPGPGQEIECFIRAYFPRFIANIFCVTSSNAAVAGLAGNVCSPIPLTGLNF